MGKIQQIYPKKHEFRLSEDALLWRYVPLRTLFSYIGGNIFIPSITKLQKGDPFEGGHPFKTEDFEVSLKESCGIQFDSVQKWIRTKLWTSEQKNFMNSNKNLPVLAENYDREQYFEFLRNTRFAWCWFKSDLESDAMWKIYGKEGVAIATSVGSLSAALKSTSCDFQFGKMFYHTRRACFNTMEKQQFVLRPHFLKRIEYIHEQEVRFVACAPKREDGGLFFSGIKPETWIKQIRLWPGLLSQEEDSLKKAIAKELPRVPCYKSDLLQTDGRAMSRMKENWRAWAATNASQQWKNDKDGVPSILKNL